MLAPLERKNCWTIAEHLGDLSPDGLQHLLARASRDAEAVRDDLRGYVTGAFADEQAVLIVMRPGMRRRASRQSGCSASTPAPPGGSRTPRSRST
jgi:hypothetical protein